MNLIKKYKKVTIFFIFIFILFGLQAQSVKAEDNLQDAFGIRLDQVAGGEGAGYNISQKSPEQIIGIIIQSVLSFLGVIFLILTIYGGYLWMTASGNEEQVSKAKKTLTAAVIGVIIVVSAYAISYFVIERLGQGALQTTAPSSLE